jgi:hypothetical protein
MKVFEAKSPRCKPDTLGAPRVALGRKKNAEVKAYENNLAALALGKSGSWAAALHRLPGFLFAQFGDVRCVVAAVPGVEEEQPVHCAWAVFGMDKNAAELISSLR